MMAVTHGALEREREVFLKNGLKVTKDVTLFSVLCQNQNRIKRRLMLGYNPTH